MEKLYFRYGAMNSGKTTQLIQTAVIGTGWWNRGWWRLGDAAYDGWSYGEEE